jgi:hypothetical protein
MRWFWSQHGGPGAARALAEFFETVTVVERDVLSDAADHRRGVPQGRQAHGLLLRGAQALEELFPGILDELVGAGAPSIDYRIYRSSTSTWAATWPCNPVRRRAEGVHPKQTFSGVPRPAPGARDFQHRVPR